MAKPKLSAGFYITLIFHLLVLIILLSSKINFLLKEDTSFIIDFSREEEIAKLERLAKIREEVSQEIDELLSGRSAVRNVAVDRSANRGERLRDDRFSDPSEIYQDARRLQENLDASKREAENLEGGDVEVPNRRGEVEEERNQESFRGPSVISYYLKDRKARRLPVPAYKSQYGGDVTVSIVVNPKGAVIDASVVTERSSGHPSLYEHAIAAAKRSRFTASPYAEAKQIGEIVYRFIAQ